MDQETKDRLFTLLSERVMSVERTLRLQNTQLRALEIAVQNHQAIFEAFTAGAGDGKPAATD